MASLVLGGLREALSGAVTDVFLATFLWILASLVVTIFLKDIPLRSRGSGGGTAGVG